MRSRGGPNCSLARAKAYRACSSDREEVAKDEDGQNDVDTFIDEKEMTKAQAFLKKKITAGAFGARSVKAAA